MVGLLVGPSVGPLVGLLVGPLVGPMVGNAFVSVGRDKPANDLFCVYKLVNYYKYGRLVDHCFEMIITSITTDAVAVDSIILASLSLLKFPGPKRLSHGAVNCWRHGTIIKMCHGGTFYLQHGSAFLLRLERIFKILSPLLDAT